MSLSHVGEIKNLHWAYRGKPLFDNLSTTLPKNSFITIVGPNGSGKTTLLRHLLRILPVPKQTIFFPEGDLVTYGQKALARHISYVPQQSRLEYSFTVYECIAMGRYAHLSRMGSLSLEDHQIIRQAISHMDLEHLCDRFATELSGGEYQRMLIARALVQQADVIALDEPVSSLDVHNQKEILHFLKHLVRNHNKTVICVLHDLNATSAFSDVVIMMNKGAIFAEGDPKSVLTKEKIREVYKVDVDIIERDSSGLTTIIPNWMG